MQGGEDCLIKQNQGKLNAVHVAIDFIISCASCTTGYFINRIFYNDPLCDYNYDMTIIIGTLLTVSLIQIIINYFYDLYRSYRSTKFIVETANLMKSNLFFCIAQMVISALFGKFLIFQVMIVLYYFINTELVFHQLGSMYTLLPFGHNSVSSR